MGFEGIRLSLSHSNVSCPKQPIWAQGDVLRSYSLHTVLAEGRFPGPRRDCVFVNMEDSEGVGVKGLLVARVYLFFRFSYNGTNYPCALVHWYSTGNDPEPDTGL